MSTTQSAATLYQLQQLDLELERLVAEQQTLAATLQANTQLKKLRTDHARAQQELRAGLQAQKDAEWTLEELNRRLKTQEQRLYSGSITNPKELATLQQEVQHLHAQQSRQEEIALEIMETAEALQETADRATNALQQAEEEWTRSNAAGLLRRDQLETKRQELQAKRTQLAAMIDAELLKRYDALRRSKQGRAISRIEQNSCQWCRVILTPSEMQRVRASSELQACSNCGRILYYDRHVEKSQS
ncbi:MAG TPA: C4-type zinc ribbon domain-containing protein [Ktedonobacteraceae bacterium]|jgi:predicted  nucleic acid-binding Zn-ribbon protein|nr:C4-type zinc ribbon domain-containing protein [Ktedonobacteraceae bacterium]